MLHTALRPCGQNLTKRWHCQWWRWKIYPVGYLDVWGFRIAYKINENILSIMNVARAATGGLASARLASRSPHIFNNLNAYTPRWAGLPNASKHGITSVRLGNVRNPALQRQKRQRQLVPSASLQQVLTVVTDTPVRDVLAVGGSIIGAKVLVGFFEHLEGSGLMDKVRTGRHYLTLIFNIPHILITNIC